VAVTAPVVFLMKVRRLLENESLGLFIAAMLTPTPAEPSTSILFKLCRFLLCWINLFGAVAMV
jgi:phage gp37-like protein